MVIGNSCERVKGVATSRLSTAGIKHPLAVVYTLHTMSSKYRLLSLFGKRKIMTILESEEVSKVPIGPRQNWFVCVRVNVY